MKYSGPWSSSEASIFNAFRHGLVLFSFWSLKTDAYSAVSGFVGFLKAVFTGLLHYSK